MKRHLISLCALAALAVTPVLAADDNRDHHRDGQGDQHTQAGHETGGNRQGGEHRDVHPAQVHTTVRDIHRTTIRNVTVQRRTIVQQAAHRPANWNNRPRQFDVHVYQRNFTAPRRYHWNAYVRPSGWYAHRWTYGETVPRVFWVRDYWVNDWWDFGLTIPPYGYEWVRYGDDVLLINISTGQVLQVEYDIFD